MIVFNYQLDLVRIRHRSKKTHDAPQVCGFSLVCVLCKALLFISESSEFRTLVKSWKNLWIKKSEDDHSGSIFVPHFPASTFHCPGRM